MQLIGFLFTLKLKIQKAGSRPIEAIARDGKVD
jgi:hypothetical protein